MLRRQFHEIGLNSQLEELAPLAESQQGVDSEEQNGHDATSVTNSVEELEIVYRSQATNGIYFEESFPQSHDEPTTAFEAPTIEPIASLDAPMDAVPDYQSFDEATELPTAETATSATIWSSAPVSPSASSSSQTSTFTPAATQTVTNDSEKLSEATLIQAAMFLNYTVYGEDKIRSYYTGADDNGYDDNYIQYLQLATFGNWEVLTAESLGAQFFDSDHYFEGGGLYVGIPKDLDDNSAEALAVRAVVDGQDAIILSFRGTDGLFSEGFLEGQTWTGVGAANYYRALRPIIEATYDYATKNAVEKVIVTGHSLGGSMADIFASTDAQHFVDAGIDLSVVSVATAGIDPTLPRHLDDTDIKFYEDTTDIGYRWEEIPFTNFSLPRLTLNEVYEPTAFQYLSINNENDPVPYPPGGLFIGENVDFSVDYTFTTPNLLSVIDPFEADTHYSYVYWASLQGIFGDRLFGLYAGHEIIVGNANYDDLTTFFGVPINYGVNSEEFEDDDSWGRALGGTSTNDYILGLSGNDHIYGNAGNDLLSGGSGRDYIEGGEDSDTIDGGSGRDELLGGSGNDVLSTSGEGDLLSGGGGSDIFSFDFEFGYVGNSASILDFEDGIDLIDLSAFEGLRFSDLAIDEINLTAQITVGGTGGQISVLGVSSSNLNAVDFIFASELAGYAVVIDLSVLAPSEGFVIQGDTEGDTAGYSVASAGDINGDGYFDMIIGAPQGDDGGSAAGEAYVIYGGTNLANIDLSFIDPSVGFVIQGDIAGDWAGYSVASAGDINGDGYDDLIVGAPYNDDGGTNAGAAYVIFGGTDLSDIDLSSLDPSVGFVILGDVSEDWAGYSVASAGDINGDGYDDLIVGALYNDDGGTNAGAAYVIFGGTDLSDIDLTSLDASDGFVVQGYSPTSTYGAAASHSVASAGDINGDGYDDLIVGAIAGNKGGTDSGEAYVIYGGDSLSDIDLSSLDPSTGFVIQGDAKGDNAGYSVASAGDINGDGYDDLIVGAPYGDDAGTVAGEAYVIYGGRFLTDIDLTSLDASDGFVIQAAASRDFVGGSVASAGDINDDGYDDLIVGAYGGDGGGDAAGETYVIFGRSDFASVVDVSAEGIEAEDWML